MVDVESVAVISTEASGEAFPWSGVELFDKSRGGDETRHKYLTHSEWHTDSKFVGLFIKSGLPSKYSRKQVFQKSSLKKSVGNNKGSQA